MTLQEILLAGMNNPECSLYVGMVAGELFAFRSLVLIFIIYGVLKFLDKLALEPLIAWIRVKWTKVKP